MDAGHIAQNLQLAAESCGLGLCPVAAFFDDEVNGILQLDGDHETVIYLAPLGKR
jgi:nitroreductase